MSLKNYLRPLLNLWYNKGEYLFVYNNLFMPDNFYSSGRYDLEKKELRAQKALFLALVIIGVFLLFISLSKLKSQVYSPLIFSKNSNSSNLSKVESETLSNYSLQTTDTDGDGLSDYDELYIYSTSPYLADTDSDGISDYDEIFRGTDPLCAEGEDCYGLNNPASIDEENEAKNNIDNQPENQEVVNQEELKLIEELVSGQASPSVLRELLLNSGLPAEGLDLISDEDLKESYLEIIAEQSIGQPN